MVDEAGLVGSRQMQRVVEHAEAAGAKVVMVGDPEQLQAIEAGAAFRALAERHGAAEITEVRRQHTDWQQQATRELATGRTSQAAKVRRSSCSSACATTNSSPWARPARPDVRCAPMFDIIGKRKIFYIISLTVDDLHTVFMAVFLIGALAQIPNLLIDWRRGHHA